MAGGRLGNVLQILRRTVQPAAGDEATDRQLLERFAARREEEAFAALVARHGPLVLAVCRRVLGDEHAAEDAFQATFLVLATKAGAVGWHESVAGWLQATAYRAASNLRAGAQRRQRHERQVPPMPNVDPLTDVTARDLRRVLDEELARLPDKYRTPLVLCYLEGKTNEEAARQLGWTKGTVSGRLAQARDLLRGRLARRGLALSAAGCLEALSQNAVTAAVPAVLFSSTIKAALLAPPAQAAAAGAVSAAVADLAEGVLKAMFVTKLKIVAVMLLVIGLVGSGAGWLTYQTLAGGTTGVAAFVPVPEPGRASNEPKASAPVVKDRLSLALKPAKAVFGPKEPLEFTVTIKNTSDNLLLLHDTHDTYDWRHFAIENTQTGESWRFTSPAPQLPPPFPLTAALASNRPWEVRVVFDPSKEVRGKGRTLRFFKEGSTEAGREFLPPGSYRCRFNLRCSAGDDRWQLYDPIAGKRLSKDELKPPVQRWSGELRTNPVEFVVADKDVADGKARSQPIRSNGVDFETVADRTWKAPPAGKQQEVYLALQITNRGDKELTFNLFDTLWVHLKSPDGKELRMGGGRDRTSPAAPISIVAGQSETVVRRARLEWLPDGKTLRLIGPDGSGGIWHFDGLQPGQYRLSISYENKIEKINFPVPANLVIKGPLWVGRVQTEDVQVEIGPLNAEGP